MIGSDYTDTFVGDSNDNVFIVGFTDAVDGKGGNDAAIYRDLGDLGVTLSHPLIGLAKILLCKVAIGTEILLLPIMLNQFH
ncbi:hypothetical protein [Vibrio taketomensis]|uniref:hypothetical protein n=1 Tax=Vibrio taketomensis TaxID=2572923 RepID=UPI001389A61F|nr:hypothetical protein [Vibrio taketomensis]